LTPRRIGMFGGAFDPPHLGVFPTGQAWHKARELSPAVHRLAMARLAFAGVPHACVDERELQRAGPTYTVDTLRELRLEFPEAELLLVIGADQAESLHSWREGDVIARLATIAIAAAAARAARAGGIAADAGQLHRDSPARRRRPGHQFSGSSARCTLY
jgi:nicotinate-nucleotide adenylyltransferase